MPERIKDIRFMPTRTQDGSMIGFVDFTYDAMQLRDVAVHVRADGKGYRLVYPKNKGSDKHIVRPMNTVAQEEIDRDVTEYLRREIVI